MSVLHLKAWTLLFVLGMGMAFIGYCIDWMVAQLRG